MVLDHHARLLSSQRIQPLETAVVRRIDRDVREQAHCIQAKEENDLRFFR